MDLAEKWSVNDEIPQAYFSFLVPDMPNYFCFIGPNSVISNGSLVLGIQATAVYIYKWLDKMQREMVRSFEVRKDVTDEYNRHMQAYLVRTVWTRGCRSWYKRGTIDGPVVAVYGGGQRFILWMRLSIPDGRILTLKECRRRAGIGLCIWGMDLQGVRVGVEALGVRRRWILMASGIYLFCLTFMIRCIGAITSH